MVDAFIREFSVRTVFHVLSIEGFLAALAQEAALFSRSSSIQPLRLVRTFQSEGTMPSSDIRNGSVIRHGRDR